MVTKAPEPYREANDIEESHVPALVIITYLIIPNHLITKLQLKNGLPTSPGESESLTDTLFKNISNGSEQGGKPPMRILG